MYELYHMYKKNKMIQYEEQVQSLINISYYILTIEKCSLDFLFKKIIFILDVRLNEIYFEHME